MGRTTGLTPNHRSRRSHFAIATFFVLVLALIVPLLSASTPTPGRDPWDSEEGPRPTEVTKSLEVEVKEVRPNRSLVIVYQGEETEIQLGEKVTVRAESKKEFDGRRKLAFRDIEAGQRLRLTFRADNGQILRARILKTRI